jgi:hypothetical protein
LGTACSSLPAPQDGRTLLLDAVQHAHVCTVAALLAAEADPNEGGPASALSPLTAAACVEDAALSRQLIFLLRRAGADLQRPDRAGRTALEYARRLEGPFRPGSAEVLSDLEAPLPEVVLPKNWTTAVDPDLGETYYFNVLTKAVSWQLPQPEIIAQIQSQRPAAVA